MDSVRPDVLNFFKDKGVPVVHDHDQDTTDLEKCLKELTSNVIFKFGHYSQIQQSVIVLGGLGGNFTQELSNLNALYLFRNIKIVVVSNDNAVFLLQPGHHVLHCRKHTKVGLIPLGKKVQKVTTKGLRWNLGTLY